jgi:long-subunit acyl-CoA synthetase (AMP-forming)
LRDTEWNEFLSSAIRRTLCNCGSWKELLTCGYAVMLGYHDDPAATAAAIDSGGWLHTGDLAEVDERGYFHVDGGRRK